MIYSRFGTKLTPLSKEQDQSGRITVQVAVEDAQGTRDYALADLTADDGMPEITEVVARLPWKVVEKKDAGGRATSAERTAKHLKRG
jgi:hypothetical protein